MLFEIRQTIEALEFIQDFFKFLIVNCISVDVIAVCLFRSKSCAHRANLGR